MATTLSMLITLTTNCLLKQTISEHSVVQQLANTMNAHTLRVICSFQGRQNIFTVYFLVWQFMYVMCKWECYELSWPLLIFQQASSCISSSLTVFFLYDILYRYVPFQLKIIFVWSLSLYDIVACLYIHGRLQKLFKRYKSTGEIPYDTYVTYDVEDGKDNDDSQQSIGLGDFWFGCIACIQVGYCITILLKKVWKLDMGPALPCSVVNLD
ncbi:hypothetical protein I4U23_005029 [Adineta vaga]|nr:hypothetical protein I4U23_005029 [Adineta vaga]